MYAKFASEYILHLFVPIMFQMLVLVSILCVLVSVTVASPVQTVENTDGEWEHPDFCNSGMPTVHHTQHRTGQGKNCFSSVAIVKRISEICLKKKY